MIHQRYELSSDTLELCKGKLVPGIAATWGEVTGNIENQKDLVSYISAHGGGNAEWGSISGNLSDQTDLMGYMDRFATTAWIGEQDYLHKYNASGDKSMIFNTSWNSIYLRDAEQQLNITGEGIAMYSTVPYDSGVSNVGNAYFGSTNIGLNINGHAGQVESGDAKAGIGTWFRESDSYAGAFLYVSGITGWETQFHSDRMSVWFFSDGIGSQKREIIYKSIVVSSDLYSYATKWWVSAQSYATESWISSQGYVSSVDLSQYATRQWVTGRGYATESWVSSQGYITASSLSGYIHFDESSPLSGVEKTLPFYSSRVGLFPVYQSFSSTWVNIEMTTNEVGIVSMGLVCYDSVGSTVWFDKFQTTNDMTGYVSRSYVDWMVQAQGYPFSVYTLTESGNYIIGSLDDTTQAFTGIKVSGSQAGAYTVISSGLQYQESFSPFALNSDLAALASRVTDLETNYGDAVTITNNILGV